MCSNHALAIVEPLENLPRTPHCENLAFPVRVDILKRGVVHFQMPSLKRNTLLDKIARDVLDHSVTCPN